MPGKTPLFAFDLDGTVTSKELLPEIAAYIGLGHEIGLLTQLTLAGIVDFETSFRVRFHVLKQAPLESIHRAVLNTPLDPFICDFIQECCDDCVIITGNLDAWIEPIRARLECCIYSSQSQSGQQGLLLKHIVNKGDVVRMLSRATGRPVVAIGESAGDIAMFEAAAVRVAFAGVHAPHPHIMRMADHVADNGHELCRLLRGMIR